MDPRLFAFERRELFRIGAKSKRFGSLPFNYYSSVLDPHVVPSEESGVEDLAYDLADIYADLSEGFSLFRAGHTNEAVWSWCYSFRIHWGRHAVSAIRSLHIWFDQNGEW